MSVLRWAIGWILLPALAGLACEPERDPALARGSTLVVSHRIADEALSPAGDTWAKFLVFLPLLGLNEEGALEGRLAASWEHSADWREWTYHLRTNARWHDGVPVTAHDVKFTLDLLSHPNVLFYPPGYIESVTVPDDSTVTIRSTAFSIADGWWATYLPKHLLEHLDPKRFYDWQFWTRPVGNGPYRFVRHVPGTMMEFEANPDYYGETPRIDRVVLKFDREGRLTELLSGNVDVISTANPSEIPKVANDPRFRIYQYPDGLVRVLYWKNDHPVLRDVRVRRALTLAIDRDELQRTLSIPEWVPVVDGILPPEDLLRGHVPVPLPYDPARARGLLEEAGWVDRDGNGIRERDGQPLRFTLLVPGSGSGRGVWSRAAVFVQDRFRKVGVRMELEHSEVAVVRERLRSGEFEAVLDFSGYTQWLRQIFGEGSVIGYRNPAVAALVDRLAQTAAPVERGRIRRDLIAIFQEDVPVTFIGPIAWTVFAHRRLRGLSSPWRTNPLQHMGELWLEEE